MADLFIIVVFVDAAEAGNAFVFPGFINKTSQTLFKLIRAFPGRIDIGNPNSFISIWKGIVVFPSQRVTLNLIQDVRRKDIGCSNQREDGRTVRRVADVREKELLNIYVTDGVIHAQVRDVRKED